MNESPIIVPNKLPDNVCPLRGFFPMMDHQGRVVGAIEGPCIDKRCVFWSTNEKEGGNCTIVLGLDKILEKLK